MKWNPSSLLLLLLVVLVVLCCSQIRTVKVFAREEHEDSNYGKQIDEAYKLGAKV